MSASGTGPFENDSAMDLCDELRGLSGEAVLAELERVLSEAHEVPAGEFLDRDQGEPAVAAAALVIAWRSEDDVLLASAALDEMRVDIPDGLLVHSVAALRRVVVEGQSEAYDLWEEVGRGQEWRSRVGELQERLLGLSR